MPDELGVKHLTPENWLVADAVAVMIHRTDSGAAISGSEWVELTSTPKISDSVPRDIHRMFEVARGAMIYGYFFYPLLTLGEQHLYRAIEAAVTLKCHSLQGPAGRETLSQKLDWLLEHGSLTASQRQDWDSLRIARNEASHPRFQSIILPNFALFMLGDVAKEINLLFDHTTPTS